MFAIRKEEYSLSTKHFILNKAGQLQVSQIALQFHPPQLSNNFEVGNGYLKPIQNNFISWLFSK